MTRRLRLSPKAQRDIDEIWNFTSDHWGMAQADSYLRRLDARMALLAKRPQIGHPCPEIRAGYFRFPCEGHMIFYRLVNSEVEIVRILHKAMDVSRHLN